jgi:hypothetical protein
VEFTCQIRPQSAAFGCGLLTVVTVLLYGPTVRYDFVWDDIAYIVQNPAVQSWGAIPSWFSSSEAYVGRVGAESGAMFRPLRNLSYLIDHSLFGLAPGGWHAHNVLLHGINGCLVAWLLYQLLGRKNPEASGASDRGASGKGQVAPAGWSPGGWGIGLASLWWTLHPLQTEVVAWVKSRDDLMATTWVLGAVVLTLRSIGRLELPGSRAFWVLGLGFAAYLSKESTVLLGPILALMGVLLVERGTNRRQVLILAGWSVGLALVFVLWRFAVLGQVAQSPRLSGSVWADLWTMLGVLVRYAGLGVLPLHQVADYQGYPIIRTALNGWVVLGALLLVGSAGFVIVVLWGRLFGRDGQRGRGAVLGALGVGWAGAALVPVSNGIPMMQYAAERFLYLPLVGLAVVVGVVVAEGLARIGPRQKKAVLLSAGIYLGVLGVLCVLRVPVWQNRVTLFTSIFEDGWPNGRSNQNYSAILFEKGRIEEAHYLMLETLHAEPGLGRAADPSMLHQGLALTSMALGRSDSATTHIQEALRLNPGNLSAVLTSGSIQTRLGQYAGAAQAYRMAHELNPGNPKYLQAVEQLEAQIRRRNPTGP